MGAKYGTEFRIAMGFAGVEVQTSADLIGKSPVIILQDPGVPADTFETGKIIHQGLAHDFYNQQVINQQLCTVRRKFFASMRT